MKFWRGAFFTLLLFLTISSLVLGSGSLKSKKNQSPVQSNVSADYWPQAEWRRSSPEAQGMDSEYLLRMLNYIKNDQKDIHSVHIIRNGYLVTEAYFYPYQKDFKHAINSCTKSITSALIGIAFNEGYIKDVNEKVLPYFSDLKVDRVDARKEALTLEHLLTMSTGLEWTEDGSYGSERDSWTQIWKSDNQIKYILDRPMRGDPGKEFYYCTGASHLLSGVLQRTTGKSAFEYGKEKLLEPMGIKDIFWPSDLNGVSNGGAGIHMTPTDMAKFGYLYLKRGRWDGQQLIPERWVEASTQNQIDTTSGWGGNGYGYQWWMNSIGGYSARGYGGQYIFVLPQIEMVVVFTSGLPELFFPEFMLKSYIIPAVQLSDALKPNKNNETKLANFIKSVSQTPESNFIPQMPDIAKRISGKKFVMEDLSSYSLIFADGKECWLNMSVNGAKYKVPVGLDDVFRITDLGKLGPLPDNNKGAFKGSWIDENTFVITYRELSGYDEFKYHYTFDGDKVKISILSKVRMASVYEGEAIMEE